MIRSRYVANAEPATTPANAAAAPTMAPNISTVLRCTSHRDPPPVRLHTATEMGWHAVRAPVRQQGQSLPTKTDPGQQRFTTRTNTTNPTRAPRAAAACKADDCPGTAPAKLAGQLAGIDPRHRGHRDQRRLP